MRKSTVIFQGLVECDTNDAVTEMIKSLETIKTLQKERNSVLLKINRAIERKGIYGKERTGSR